VAGDQRQTARTRHLDDRDPTRQNAPLGVDRITERAGHTRDATRSSACSEQGIERALASIGERQLDDVVETGAAESGCDRGRGLVSPQRSSELVGARNRSKRRYDGHSE
jgi:hypothetical protein